jgi:hypothetical protein
MKTKTTRKLALILRMTSQEDFFNTAQLQEITGNRVLSLVTIADEKHSYFHVYSGFKKIDTLRQSLLVGDAQRHIWRC